MRFIYTKGFLIFAITLAVLLIALFLQVKGFLQPVEYALLQTPRPVISATKAVAEPVRSFFSTAFNIRGIVRENTELHTKVHTLQQSQAAFDKLRLENELLHKELDFAQRSAIPLQPCTVLSIDPQELSDALVLNCGEQQGLKVGQAVLAEGFLIAKLVHVGSYTSTAVLITNAQSSIDARVSKNGIEGVIKGSFGSGIILDLVSQNADLQSGDLVVTGGISDRIPKDIIIGEIGQIISGSNDLFKKASITSPVRMRSVEYVFVAKQ